MMRPNILIFGAGGHARVVLDTLLAENQMCVVGVIDNRLSPGETLLGIPVLGTDADVPRIVRECQVSGFVVAIGDNWRRGQLTQRVCQRFPELKPACTIHPGACVSRFAQLGPGTVVLPGAVVNAGVSTGPGCLLNTHCSVDHDCQLGAFVSIGPHACLGGNVHVGDYSAICLGAHVTHSVDIGQATVVGAGALVLEDLPDGVVAYGIPARPVRSRCVEETYL
ncbi:MAG: acetyltransferase [Gemmatales bacterium]|nr:acetyltransferase [Gemmatales bacterium]MCS7159421.1 acetyltransferase [Gemmatales bacterium]MDW8174620.1 acetyltransferase [Gemmatales bacterium]MDW8221932.1 acetyltransferase [Gemmatales bacterium]